MAATSCGAGSSWVNSRWRLSLLAGAGLAIHSFWNLTRVDLGVRTDHVLTFRLQQPQGRFDNPEQMNVYNQQMLSALQSVPGVSAAATVTGMPLRYHSDGMPFTVVGGATYADPSQRPGCGFPIGLARLLQDLWNTGAQRALFNEQDTATSVRVAVVNEEFASRYLERYGPFPAAPGPSNRSFPDSRN